jgi:hypothetical protein
MCARRRTIPLNAAEDGLIRLLYLELRYPSDQYERRPVELARFVQQWNELAERSDTSEEVMHYIITKRKNSQWVTFDGDYERMSSVRDEFLTAGEWHALREAYEAVMVSRSLGSDNIRWERDLARELVKEFRARTGRRIHHSLLLAAIEAKRKRGLWVKIGKTDIGFSDIDQLG